MIEHLTDKDYLTSYDGKTFSNLGERIENVESEKEILKTAKLENTKPIFTIGTDKNGIDISDGIYDGEVGIELQGQTLANLLPKHSVDHMVNMGSSFSITSDGYISLTGNSGYQNAFFKPLETLKTNTTYTVIVDVKECSLTGTTNSGHLMISSNNANNPDSQFIERGIIENRVGLHFVKLTTFSDLSDKSYSLRSFLNNSATGGSIVFRMMLLEGDHTNKSLSFFEGIKSVGETNENKIEILSVGKNLFNINNVCSKRTDSLVEILDDTSFKVSGTWYVQAQLDGCKPNTTYRVSGQTEYTRTEKVLVYDVTDDGRLIKQILSNESKYALNNYFTTPSTFTNIALLFYCGNGTEQTGTTTYKNIMVEEGKVSTEYEPHKSDKTKISLNEPLRGLPNGVCDEIVGGKIIRRVGKYEVEVDKIVVNTGYTTDTLLTVYLDKVMTDANPYGSLQLNLPANGLSNNFTMGYAGNQMLNRQFRYGSSRYLFFAFTKTEDMQGLIDAKQWFEANPTTIYYELATPIIEEIEPIILDSYENGTLFIDSTIVPTSIHQVTLKNMNFLVEKNIKEIAKLKERLSELKSFYDVSLLEMDYELTREKLTYYLATYGLGE